MFYKRLNKFRKLSSKLNMIICLIILLLTFAMSLFFSVNYSRTTEKEMMQKNIDLLDVCNDNLSVYLKQLSDLSLECRRNEEMMSFLEDSSQDDYTRQNFLSSWVTSILFSRTDIQTVSLYIPDTKEVYLQSRKKGAPTRREIDNTYEKEAWYQNLAKSKKFYYIEPAISDEDFDKTFLQYHRSIIDIQTQKILAVISFTMKYDYFESLFLNKLYDDEIFALLDRQKQLYFCNDEKRIGNLMEETSWWKEILNSQESCGDSSFEYQRNNYNVVFSKNNQNDWIAIRIISEKAIEKPIDEMIRMIFLFSIVLLVGVIPMVILISKTITKPLHNLAKTMEGIQLENYELIPENNQNDETGQLLKSFNNMMVRLKESVDKEYKMELAMKNAQIKAIEAQLNPHFLYNTLQMISTKALVANMPEISDMIDMLALNFRYTIRPESLVNIQDELRFVQNYVALQKARFNDRLTVVYRIDKFPTENILVPKLCLQIPVENAIVHGMENRSEGVAISVTVQYYEHQIELTVHNDGTIIPPERLEYLRKEFQNVQYDFKFKNDAIGLVNLNACLRLTYGENDMLFIASDEINGTIVKITIPIKEGR